jgi:mannose-1-phosphate guanylyltransferase
MRFAVILAGGPGERFWPISRRARPKPLAMMPDGRTLLQAAVARLEPMFTPDRILVVTSADCVDEVRRQAPKVEVIGEPVSRDTAPAIELAATLLEKRSPGGSFVSLHADHVITRPDAFRDCVGRALDRAETGALVTLGITPRGPEPTWGYIERGAAIAPGIFSVARFHEKPDRAAAERYLVTGRFYWNAGIFAWRSRRILDELSGLKPDQRISIDHAVMEKARNVEVVEADIGLYDVGTWQAFAERFPATTPGTVDSRECVVVSTAPDHLVAVFGAEDLVVVHTPDATLVCPRGADLKKLIEALRARGLDRYL